MLRLEFRALQAVNLTGIIEPVNMQHHASTRAGPRLHPPSMADSIRERLGLAVRARREAHGLTQEAVSTACGVSVRHWRALEAGGPSVTLDVIERVLTGLEWSWHELADALEPRKRGGGAASAAHQLEAVWPKATAREKEIVQAVLKALSQPKR